jgi:hypothetical protein
MFLFVSRTVVTAHRDRVGRWTCWLQFSLAAPGMKKIRRLLPFSALVQALFPLQRPLAVPPWDEGNQTSSG